jgi:GT2 family glycosyltransferase
VETEGGIEGGEVTSVIIPSRKVENLRPCIQAIDRFDPTAPIRIIVVDDGLSEQPPPRVNALEVRTIPGVKPFVFSRNINIGIRDAGDDDVILLNDDCLLTTTGGFTKLIEVGGKHPECGIVAPACNNVGNRNQHFRGIGLREELRMVCFTCVWIPRTALRSVGLLDEQFVAYSHQDDDYCLRVRNAELKIGVFDGCVMDHGSLPSTFRSAGHCPLEPGAAIFAEKWGMDNFGRPVGARHA